MKIKTGSMIIQCIAILSMSLLAGCPSAMTSYTLGPDGKMVKTDYNLVDGGMTSHTSGPDGKMIKTNYSFVYRQMMIASDGKIGIDLIIDQQEKKRIPLARELGALPPSDMYSKASVPMRLINLTNEPLEIEILSYKKPNGELLTNTSKLTIPAEGSHLINFGDIVVGTYDTEIKGIVVEYTCQGVKNTARLNPKRLTSPQWDEYYYAPDRIKASTAAELFRKTYNGQ